MLCSPFFTFVVPLRVSCGMMSTFLFGIRAALMLGIHTEGRHSVYHCIFYRRNTYEAITTPFLVHAFVCGTHRYRRIHITACRQSNIYASYLLFHVPVYFVPVARACLLPTLLVTKFDNESGIWLLRGGTYNGEQRPETLQSKQRNYRAISVFRIRR
jgi:hypothetical protein